MNAFPQFCFRFGLLLFTASVLAFPLQAAPHRVTFELQRRDVASGQPIITPTELDPTKVGVVVVDMWNWHWCKTSTARANDLETLSCIVPSARPDASHLPRCPHPGLSAGQIHWAGQHDPRRIRLRSRPRPHGCPREV